MIKNDKKLYIFEDAQSDDQRVLALSNEQLAVFYWLIDAIGYDFSVVALCDKEVENIDTATILKKWGLSE